MPRKPQANPVRRFARLTLEGHTFELCYDYGAIARAEKESGQKLLSGLLNLGDLSAGQLAGLLAAAIEPARPGFTVKDAEALLSAGVDNIAPACDALAEAYELSLRRDKKNPPRPEAGS